MCWLVAVHFRRCWPQGAAVPVRHASAWLGFQGRPHHGRPHHANAACVGWNSSSCFISCPHHILPTCRNTTHSTPSLLAPAPYILPRSLPCTSPRSTPAPMLRCKGGSFSAVVASSSLLADTSLHPLPHLSSHLSPAEPHPPQARCCAARGALLTPRWPAACWPTRCATTAPATRAGSTTAALRQARRRSATCTTP